MDNTDRLAAAIFAAAKCSALGTHEQQHYIDQYDAFIQLMKDREAALKKPVNISNETLARSRSKRR
jgi:hypothetical protein